MPYTDFHRALVQSFLVRATMTGTEAKSVIAALLKAEDAASAPLESVISDADVAQYIADINDELSKFDFEIRSMRDQKDRHTIWAFVNSNPDTIIQTATHHSADEIAFFRRLLDAMFETNNTLRAEVLAIRGNDALHLNKNPPPLADEELPAGMAAASSSGGLTLKQAEGALQVFVDEGWLQKSRANWYTLAPRGLLELRVYLEQTYNDCGDMPSDEEADEDERPAGEKRIKDCYACKELLTVGQRCEKLTCPVRLHDPCSTAFFRVHRGKKCPGCKRQWNGTEVVGEGAAGKLRKRGGQRRSVATPAARRQRSVTNNGGEGVEDAPDEGEEGEGEEGERGEEGGEEEEEEE